MADKEQIYDVTGAVAIVSLVCFRSFELSLCTMIRISCAYFGLRSKTDNKSKNDVVRSRVDG